MTLLHQAAQKAVEAALKPCPFCGKANTLKLATAEELANEGEDDPVLWEHSPSWAVICDASQPLGPGGCGAEGGFYPSQEEAIAAWNRRESALQQQPEPVATDEAAYQRGKRSGYIDGYRAAHADERQQPDISPALQHQEAPREPVADTVDSIVAEFVAGLQRAEAKRKQRLSDLPAGTCETCMGEGYLGSIESQRITDCPDCIGGVRIAAASPSTTRQQEVGSGWKLVPVEPTQEMVDAGDAEAPEPWRSGFAREMWSAMLAAAPSTPEKAGGVSERTHDQEPAASYPPGGVKSPGDTAANSSAETKANAIDMLLVKVHQHLAQALRIPTMPWPEPAAHGHEATGRAIHAAYCAMRFKIMDAIAELTAARCGITAAVIEDTTAALPSPIPHPLPAQANDGGEHG